MTINTGILKEVASALKPRAPIVVISADSAEFDCETDNDIFDAKACLENIGFDVLICVSVPPKGFTLPKSKKSKHMTTKKLKGTSNCSILIALAQ